MLLLLGTRNGLFRNVLPLKEGNAPKCPDIAAFDDGPILYPMGRSSGLRRTVLGVVRTVTTLIADAATVVVTVVVEDVVTVVETVEVVTGASGSPELMIRLCANRWWRTKCGWFAALNSQPDTEHLPNHWKR